MTFAADHTIMRRLQDQGLAEVGATGQWQLTARGREVYEEHRMLYQLAKALRRSGAAPGSSPWRQAPPARRSGATAPLDQDARPGDDVPAGRGRGASGA